MANPKIWVTDRALNRFSAVFADNNTDLAPYLVDLDQSSRWTAGDPGPNAKIYGDLGDTYDIRAIGFGNCTLTEGVVISVYRGAALGANTTLQQTFAGPAAKDFVLEFTPSGGNMRFWTIQFGTTSASMRIGSISVLDYSTMLEIPMGTDGTAPTFQTHEIDTGFLAERMGTGGPMVQVLGGTVRRLAFSIVAAKGTAGEFYEDIMDSIDNNDGWARGVWLTDDTAAAGVGRAKYCIPIPGVAIAGEMSPGPYGDITLRLEELGKGVQQA